MTFLTVALWITGVAPCRNSDDNLPLDILTLESELCKIRPIVFGKMLDSLMYYRKSSNKRPLFFKRLPLINAPL